MLNNVNSVSNVSNQLAEDSIHSIYCKTRAAMIALLERMGNAVDPEELLFKGYEYVVWDDASLGNPQPGSVYAQVRVPGIKWQYQYRHVNYNVHTNYDGSQLVVAGGRFSGDRTPVEQTKAPSIFELSAGQSKVVVSQVSRHSDLDKNEFFFNVTLKNGQTFQLPASLEELQSKKIDIGMPFEFVGEEFVTASPGRSTFTYRNAEKNIQLQNEFNSISSHWHPDGSQPVITLTEKFAVRGGMSNFSYNIRFSDGSGWGVPYQYFSGLFTKGDSFFKVRSDVLVNVATGRVIYIHNLPEKRSVKITW
jgi:hypothetical protein